jgi:aspartate beta-hydroxylase
MGDAGEDAGEPCPRIDIVELAGFDQRVDGGRAVTPPYSIRRRHTFQAVYASSNPTIRAEALTIAERLDNVPRFHELMPEQTAISASDDRDWRMFILKGYGIEVHQNMAACPVLAGLIRQAPEVTSAAVSFLAPYKHIPPHYGPFKGILRFHLMLSMPMGSDGKPAAV